MFFLKTRIIRIDVEEGNVKEVHGEPRLNHQNQERS